ncbi:hypothetical protein EUX98_g2548 [Antrodiella citrinella]|uniref:Uncharacterized protein n=1 Tax=Antrodiella citrinella TaxID=2447956 RepID=A0A4S4MYS4_9APHY|nr:hypothetical protein EUX98_g2548 [Antrodiella citrinella]
MASYGVSESMPIYNGGALPIELQLEIIQMCLQIGPNAMSYSEYKSMLSSLTRVCRMFCDMCQPSLFATLECNGWDGEQKNDALLALFGRFEKMDTVDEYRLASYVKEFRINNWDDNGNNLDVHTPKAMEMVFKALQVNAQHFPNLRTLTLCSIPLGGGILNTINALSQLEQLVIEDWFGVRAGRHNESVSRSPRSPFITSLTIRDVSRSGVPVAVTTLVDTANLRILVADWDCVRTILAQDLYMPQLTELSARGPTPSTAEFSEDEWALLVKALGMMPALQSLTVVDVPQLTTEDPPDLPFDDQMPQGLHTLCSDSLGLVKLLVWQCPIRHFAFDLGVLQEITSQVHVIEDIRNATGTIKSLTMDGGMLKLPHIAAQLQDVESLTFSYEGHITSASLQLRQSFASVVHFQYKFLRSDNPKYRHSINVVFDLQGQLSHIRTNLVSHLPSATKITYAGIIQWRKVQWPANLEEPEWRPTILDHQQAKERLLLLLSSLDPRDASRIVTDVDGCLENLKVGYSESLGDAIRASNRAQSQARRVMARWLNRRPVM